MKAEERTGESASAQLQPETISRLLNMVYPPFAMLAGMELDLFTPLKDGPLSAERLATIVGVQVIKLRPLLYALVVAGLLIVEEELFSNTAEAEHFLVRGEPGYLGELQELTSDNWKRMLRTAETIRAGGPPARLDYHAPAQGNMVALFRGLYPGARADAHRLMNRFDFSTRESLLDVGGGSGALAITIAQATPHLKATVLELPSVAPVTRQFIDEANLGERVTAIIGDAVHDSLSGSYDVIVARHVAQVLSANDCRTLLKNLATILDPGGVIHLVGWVLDDSRVSPQKTVGYNLILLTAYQDGQAYTEQEYHEWLAGAGLLASERVVFPDGTSIVTARKPG